MDEETRGILAAQARAIEALTEELRRSRVVQDRAGPQRATKTLRELYTLYEATWATARWAPAMRSTLSAALRHFGDRKADEITRADWIHWRDHVRSAETTIRKGPPTIYTRNLEFKRWRQVYTWGLVEGHCFTNPLAAVKAARGGKKHRETEPTRADLAKVRPHVDDETWAFLLLGFRRGFRAREARLLEWRQIDLDRGVITLWASQDKTGKQHTMRIPSDLVAALRAIRPDIPPRYVFRSPRTGDPYDASTLWRRVRLAFDAAGLQAAPGDGRVTYHDTRHGFASGAARRSPLQVAMRLTRHTSLTAAQRYIHVNDADLEDAYRKLEEDNTERVSVRVTDDENLNRAK